jgi:hypothetical protein
MKQFFFLVSLTACVNMYATVRTVNNNPNSLAQFSTIQAAIDVSASGDTIYVHGSNTAYTQFTITGKRLTIIGPGWAPLRSFQVLKATVPSFTFGLGSDGSEIQGLIIVGQVLCGFNHPNNLRFIRNQFTHQVAMSYGNDTYSGYVFQDNWFDNGQIVANTNSNYINCIFQNNIFYSTSSMYGNVYGFAICTNVLFDHNLWYGPSSGSSPCFWGSCSLLSITNNIFVRRDASANCTSSTFNNNITFNAGVNNPWAAIYGNSDAGGNVQSQDPQMADQDSVNAGHDNPLLNFTIATGLANNAGTDGKDMGLMYDPSGILNWTNTRMSRIPYIYSMNISNPSIAPGGTLSVQVEARKSN